MAPGYMPAELVIYAVVDHRHYACVAGADVGMGGSVVRWVRRVVLVLALVGALVAMAVVLWRGPVTLHLAVLLVGAVAVIWVLIDFVVVVRRGRRLVDQLARRHPAPLTGGVGG